MATLDEQIDLAYNTVVNLGNLAEDSYTFAKQQLDELVNADKTLALTVVDIDIGDDATINWTATYTPPADPVEPDYAAEIDEPTLPTISTPTITLGTTPDTDIALSTAPDALGDYTFSAIATLDTLPEIAVDIPAMDVDLLSVDPLDDFTEPTYTERVSTEVQAGILAVLGGDLGLPAGYWAAEWAQVSADIAQQTATETRRARNMGAASWWARPAEAVTAATRRVQEEASKRQALARFEQAKQQAVFAREDFWQAIQRGIDYENQWINAHDRVAQRALAASEQLYRVRVLVQNANIARYNSMLEAAKLDGTIDNLAVQRLLSKHQQELQKSTIEIQQAGYELEKFKTEWQGYQIDNSTRVSFLAEQVKAWNGVADADVRYKGLELQAGKLDLELMANQIAKVQGIAQATLGLLQARTALARFQIDKQTVSHLWEKDQNLIEVELTKLTQMAQEAAARIDVAQTQWLEGQGLSLKTNIAQLAYGYAQAAVNAADISYGRSINSSYSQSASQNAELVWS